MSCENCAALAEEVARLTNIVDTERAASIKLDERRFQVEQRAAALEAALRDIAIELRNKRDDREAQIYAVIAIATNALTRAAISAERAEGMDNATIPCGRCDGVGEILVCPDAMCQGLGECIHGDGMMTCPACRGESWAT